MNVKGNHPLAEIIAKKLFGITGVPKEEAEKMVNRACKEAVMFHVEHMEEADKRWRAEHSMHIEAEKELCRMKEE